MSGQPPVDAVARSRARLPAKTGDPGTETDTKTGTNTAVPACHWLLLGESSVPADSDWLAPVERRTEASLRFEKRRRDWRLGRFAAKRLLIESGLVPGAGGGELSIRAAEDGAPEAFLDDRQLDLTLSISHAGGHAVAAAASGRVALGCDIEKIEPRSAAFLETFLTRAEQRLVSASGDDAPLLANLIWSAKESWLKACRCGLRRDTQTVEVSLDPGADGLGADGQDGWRPFTLRDLAQQRSGHGWWRPVPGAASLVTVADGRGPRR